MLENQNNDDNNLQHRMRPKRGKAAPDYLSKATVLAKKFRIEKLIGGGGFGQIYRATDLEMGTVVAVKVEPQTEESGRTILEQRVLVELINTRHVPRIYYAGSYESYNFIVMQLVGRNLADLRKMQRSKRLTVHTAVRVGLQMLKALENLHDIGYLHRDVKPSNMCAGIGEHRRIIYLVDYGMTRKFRYSDGRIRRERKYAGFRGTMRYVSVNVHLRIEQTPLDDIWSLYYSLIEMSEGSLPWRSVEDQDEILKQKKWMGYAQMCSMLPRAFAQMAPTLRTMDEHTVDYNLIGDILKKCCKYVDEDADFEWDEDNESAPY